jgi:glycosyltransferase involved in cell wall biosynthesis
LKIAIDIRELGGKTTGISRFLTIFLKELAGRKNGLQFLLIGNQRTVIPECALKNPELFSVSISKEFNALWFDQVTIRKIIKDEKADLFFSPYYKLPFFSAVPCVLSLFDLTYLIMEPYKSGLRAVYYKYYLSRAVKKAKAVLTCSENSKRDILGLLSLPEEKVKVSHLAVDGQFHPQSGDRISELKKRLKISNKYILSMGNSLPHKNQRLLKSVFSGLSEDLKNTCELVLCGEGNRESAYSDPDLPALYSGAEFFVFPSLYEGFGLPPLEAMACGCPVLSSNRSSMPEILGEDCLYFDPENEAELASKIEELAADAGLRKELSGRGLRRAAGFTATKMTNSLLDILKNAIA